MYSKIFIANDHSSTDIKKIIIKHLSSNYTIVDLGTNSTDSCNYVDYANKLAKEINKNKNCLGILLCGTGVGISIAANKNQGIRCALLYNDNVAKLAKQHNNANIIAFGAREMDVNDIIRRIYIFIESEFEGGRHLERINTMK